MKKLLIYFSPLFFYGQNSSFQLWKIDENLNLIEKILFDEKPVSAFDLGNEYLTYSQNGNLTLYNHLTNKKRNNIRVFTNSDYDVYYGSGKNIGVEFSRKDIGCIRIDNKTNKVGLTLRYGMYKAVYVDNPRKTNALWNAPANEITDFCYSRLTDGYTIFYKFYPDSISMNGRLSLFHRVNITKTLFYYKEGANVEMYKAQTIGFNKDETIYGGISVDGSLWLWDTTKVNVVNVLKMDNKKIKSFSFIGNDSIAILFDNSIFISTVKEYALSRKVISFDAVIQPKLHSFIYSQSRNYFIAYTENEMILFKLKEGKFEIVSEIIVNGKVKGFKISEDGENMAILY